MYQRFTDRSVPSLSRDTARRFLSRHLRGEGVELGPGHRPYPVLPNARVRYVDRRHPQENRECFPELGEAEFSVPDIVADFDRDRLAALGEHSCDFVICSHVIEHLAEPIGFLAEIHRVLRPGGVALLLVPDRRRTFDAPRAPTSLAHLIAEHASGITDVDDDHIIDFLTRSGPGAAYLGIPEDSAARARWFEWHRERSIHVHCWSEDEFPEVIAHTISALGHTWELVDALATDAQGPTGQEFGYVLRRSPDRMPAAQRADRFLTEWRAWRESWRPVLTRPPVPASSDATLVVDAPQPEAVVHQPFLLGGWAVDAEWVTDSGIDMVEAWGIEESGMDVFLGVTSTGGLRPDVAAAVGERGRKAGYSLMVTGLPPRKYDLRVYAHSDGRNSFVAAQGRRVTIV